MASSTTLKKYLTKIDEILENNDAVAAGKMVTKILSTFGSEFEGLQKHLTRYRFVGFATDSHGNTYGADQKTDDLADLELLRDRIEAEFEKQIEKDVTNPTAFQEYYHEVMGQPWSEEYYIKQQEILAKMKEAEKPRVIFISHAHKDKEYIGAFVNLLESLGLREDDIICSSIPPYCVPLDNNIYDWLLRAFQTCNLHMIFALSKSYYASAASLNEMGAAWAMKHKWTGVLLPGFSFSDISGCIDPAQISIKLDDEDRDTLNFRLGELKDNIVEEFGLRPLSPALWERKRNEFLNRVSAITTQKAAEMDTEANDGDEPGVYTTAVGKDDVGNIPVDSAFLLVYAANGNGQIIKMQTLGSPVQVSADGKQFMADDSQRESARWVEALDRLIEWGWVKPTGHKGQIFELTGTGYNKAEWLKDGMCIDTSKEPLEELQQFGG